jgi:glycosyltransferase involved in cell wall biosynthesis
MISGASLYVYNLAVGLVRQGVRVRIHTTDSNPSKQTAHLGLELNALEISRYKCLFDIKHSYQPLSPSYVISTIKVSDDFDLVHVHDFPKICNDVLIIAMKKLRPDKQVILTPHGAGFPLPVDKLSSEMYWALGFPWKVFRDVDHVIAVSPLQAELFGEVCNPGKISIIPEALPLYYFVDEPVFLNDGKLKILFVGRIAREKGIEELLYALKEVVKIGGDNIELFCIGPDYGYLQKALQIIDYLNLNNGVRMLGPLTEREKLKYLDLCDILVLPSYYEAFGLPILEAMARGKPVIATKTVGSMSLIDHGETGFHVSPRDPQSIAEAILQFLKDPDLKCRMGRRALEKASKFRMENMVEEHICLYERLIHKKIVEGGE